MHTCVCVCVHFFVFCTNTFVALVQVGNFVLLQPVNALAWFILFSCEAACQMKLMVGLNKRCIVSVRIYQK